MAPGMRKLLKPLGFELRSIHSPEHAFRSDDYLRHNARRLEHLASLGLELGDRTVLEVGAGIGDHTSFYLDRGCRVTITEPRDENLDYLRKRYPKETVLPFDLEQPGPIAGSPYQIVHCYGVLYHLSNPEEALACLAGHCCGQLLLETCVSFGREAAVNFVLEDGKSPSQAYSGKGCRPTRAWLFERLRAHFPHVLVPVTQPNHEEFPIDWSSPEKHTAPFSRAVFVASRQPITNAALLSDLPDRQHRHP
jgi:2-polyprenyl-3-methyl-5-hydroxy-6-metoxy-1,4-benzoquinol methylase